MKSINIFGWVLLISVIVIIFTASLKSLGVKQFIIMMTIGAIATLFINLIFYMILD